MIIEKEAGPMAAENFLTIEAIFGDEFKVETKIGAETLSILQPGNTQGSNTDFSPHQYFFISLGSCVASIAGIINQQENCGVRSLKLTVKGDVASSMTSGSGGHPEESALRGIEVEVDVNADMPLEEKNAFLAEVDATLRTFFNLTAYRQRLTSKS